MLAVPGRRRSFGTEWVFERKLDGVRAIAFRDGDDIRLTSRTGRPLERTYPEIVQALARQPLEHFVVDGEIVAMNRGRTDFARLQRRMHITDPVAAGLSSIRVTYYLFDLLHLGGYDTTVLPLRSRKSLLRRAVEFTGPLRYNAHRNADPGARDLLDDACRRGWEGLVAKRADSRYQQRRSPDWVKLKCTAAQELVIAGFTEPSGSRLGFGALLLGYYEGGRLRYAGKAGTGYDDATLVGLRRRLDTLEQPHPAFDEPVAERTAHWVRPELVARIDFTEWTADGRLRHPRFVGLRDDKKAAEVIREYPASA
ncbi:non-homologous end-joining DNA ligase [Streptomyces sp. RB6PN25]|uniref:DNA ligase (ATP) n=2 Tax=Streptomyces humicola TaxID=2953240 RepID=A0ABT1PQ39_9ACTN|nr:non-homologous end-joining DNA ligase [Streptomyces humicola]MCQ4079803.1 non-homologous end-joining DNA ligase [Streptomyces humicola]